MSCNHSQTTDEEKVMEIFERLSPILSQLKGRPLQLCSARLDWLPQFAANHPGHLELAFPLAERKILTIAIQWNLGPKDAWEYPDVITLLEILNPTRETADPFEAPISVPSWPLAWQLACKIIDETQPSTLTTHSL
jgi:hypothetical protein